MHFGKTLAVNGPVNDQQSEHKQTIYDAVHSRRVCTVFRLLMVLTFKNGLTQSHEQFWLRECVCF